MSLFVDYIMTLSVKDFPILSIYKSQRKLPYMRITYHRYLYKKKMSQSRLSQLSPHNKNRNFTV